MEAKWTISYPGWTFIPMVKCHGRLTYLRWVGMLLFVPGRGHVWERKRPWKD